MSDFKRNGSLAGLGLITATVGLAASIIYFSDKYLEDKLEEPNVKKFLEENKKWGKKRKVSFIYAYF